MTRESSVASAADLYEHEVKLAPGVEYASVAAKRKAQDASAVPDKKRKPNSPGAAVSKTLRPCARLPPQVWQHIFLFCSLSDLGRLMQVNRSFLSYLTDVSNVSVSQADIGCLSLLKSESIWASARNMFSPRPPKPLEGFTELQMWQLAWSKRCQFCNKLSFLTPGDKIWTQGPGDTGVRTVWPFGIRACGPCLIQQCQTVRPHYFFTIGQANITGCESLVLPDSLGFATSSTFCSHYAGSALYPSPSIASDQYPRRRRGLQVLLQVPYQRHDRQAQRRSWPRPCCCRGVVKRSCNVRKGSHGHGR